MVGIYENEASEFSGAKPDRPDAFGLPDYSLIKTNGPQGSDPRETAETYKGELFRMGRYRVAVCREALQWLYQRRRPTITAGGVAWNTLGFCTNKISLNRLHRSHSGAEAQAITDLPFYFDRGTQK